MLFETYLEDMTHQRESSVIFKQFLKDMKQTISNATNRPKSPGILSPV